MSSQSKPHLQGLARALRAPLLCLLLGSGLNSLRGQSTPVRDLGLESSLNRSTLEPAKAVAAAPGDADSPDLQPWWEGMEKAAEASLGRTEWLFSGAIAASWEYDSNFLLRGSDAESSHVYSVRPSGMVQYGTPGHGVDFSLTYAPEFRTFSEPLFDDIINHSLNLSLGLSGARSRLITNARYARNEGGNVEVGTAVTSDVYGVNLLGSYDLSEKTTLGARLDVSRSEFQAFNSFTSAQGSVFADYAVTPKTRLGFQAGYEWVDQTNSVNQDAISAALRVGWSPRAKISVSAQLGADYRSFGGGESLITPSGNLAISYAPTGKSTLALNLYRRGTPSIGVSNAMFYATGTSLSVRQAIGEKWSGGLAVGYEWAPYESGKEDLAIDREDKFFFVRPNLSYNLLPSLLLSLFYQWTDNSSNLDDAGFSRSQVGLSMTYSF